MYSITGAGNQVLKTYTIKTQVQPKPSIIVGSENAQGLKTAKEITQFYITTENIQWNATLSGSTFSVNIPSNFALNNLRAVVQYSNSALASVPGVLLGNGRDFNYNFTNSVPIVIYAEDGSTKNYTLAVTNTAPVYKGNNACGLNNGYVNNIDFYPNTIFENSTTIGNNTRIDVPFGTDITKIKFTLNSQGSTLRVANYGIYSQYIDNVLFDFTTPLTVTSIAEDGTTSKTFTIAINSVLPQNTSTYINFNSGNNIEKVIKSGDSFTLLYRSGQDLTQCAPNFDFNGLLNTASVSGIRQVSANTKVNLSSPAVYTVRAQSGAMKNYTVTAAIFTGNEPIMLSSDKKIISAMVGDAVAVLAGYENEAEFSRNNGTISGTNIYLTVLGNNTGGVLEGNFYGLYNPAYNLKMLINGFPGNEGYYDFAKPLKITVIAQDNSTLDYIVFVTYTANGVAMKSRFNQTIAGFVIPSQVTVTGMPIVANVTATSGLVVSITSSNISVASISGTSITFLNAGMVTITAMQAGNANYNAVSIASVINVVTVVSIPTSTHLPAYPSTSFSIYPNPSINGEPFVIKNGEWKRPLTPEGGILTVYNAQGAIVYTQKIVSESTLINANLVSGIYLVKVGTASVKLVIN